MCNNTGNIDVLTSGEPDTYTVVQTTPELEPNVQLVASALSSTNDASYIYSLDGEPFTEDGVFDNVLAGPHTIYFADEAGCWTRQIHAVVISYPQWFTPNNDSYNDYWQLEGMQGFINPQIYIYDRWGKLLVKLDPRSQGWNGEIQGKELPADSYWFRVDYISAMDGDSKTFRAHFLLKR